MLTNYIEQLNQARGMALKEFQLASPHSPALIKSISQITYDFISDVEEKGGLDQYTGHLLASFMRTVVVSAELIQKSELIEAATLLRKQFELLARLWELQGTNHNQLDRKTPNLNNLKTKLNTLYGAYSESAHSSSTRMMSLLGFYKDKEKVLPVVFPEYTENTLLSLQHWVLVFLEFSLWVIHIKQSRIDEYDSKKDEEIIGNVIKLFKESGLEKRT